MTKDAQQPTGRPPSEGPLTPADVGARADEFAHVPTPRRRWPWLSLFVIAFAAYLIYHQRADLSFALSSSTPLSLGDAKALSGDLAGAPVNRYVSVSGRPDFESALLFDTQGSWVFTPFYRLMGANSRVFVQREADPLPSARAASDVYTGRLLRIRDLPYDAAIRRYFSQHVTATHAFDPRALHDALKSAARPLAVLDRAGESVALAPGDALTLDRNLPDEVRVSIPVDRFAKADQARAAITAAGAEVLALEPMPAGAEPVDGRRHPFRVRVAPERRAAVLSALADIDGRVQLRPARDALTARVGDLSADQDGFVVGPAGSATRLPLGTVASAHLSGAVELSADALLLIEGERPRDRLRAVFIAGFLLAFALVNLLAMRRPA